MTTGLIPDRVEVPRDRFDRPLLVPRGGGDRTAYRRPTTVAGALKNRKSLEPWIKRCVAVGLVERPDLLLEIASYGPTCDDKVIDDLVVEAEEAGGSTRRRRMGVALHRFTARVDGGEPDVVAPSPYDRDLDVYREAMSGYRFLTVEEMIVVESMGLAGTPDRIVFDPDGPPFVADLKTGKSVEYGWVEYAIQLAIYAHAEEFYDEATDVRRPVPWDLNRTRGMIVHLPAGEGRCTLWEVDLEAGWKLARVGLDVLDGRAMERKLSRPWPQDVGHALERSLRGEDRRGLYAVPGDGSVDPETSQGPLRGESGGSDSDLDPAAVLLEHKGPSRRAVVRQILDARGEPDEGPDVPEELVEEWRVRFEALPDDGRAWITAVRRSGIDVDVPPSSLALTVRPSTKRLNVARVLVTLVEFGSWARDQTVRDLLLAVDPLLADPVVPVGAALAALNANETSTLVELVELLGD